MGRRRGGNSSTDNEATAAPDSPGPELSPEERGEIVTPADVAQDDAQGDEYTEPAEDSEAIEPPAPKRGRPRKEPRPFPRVFQSLLEVADDNGGPLIDDATAKRLADLDPATTRIVLQELEGTEVTRRSARPIPLANFEPDFLGAVDAAAQSRRVAVDVLELDADPWTFCLLLPGREPEQNQRAAAQGSPREPAPVLSAPAAPAAPIAPPPPGVDASTFMMMQLMQQMQAQTQAFMQAMRDESRAQREETRALLERATAPAPKSEFQEHIEKASLDMLKVSVNNSFAQLNGDRTGITNALDQVVDTMSKVVNIRAKFDAATEAFAAQGAQPDMTDKLLAAAESPLGQALIAKLLGGTPPAPALPRPNDDNERQQAYG
jgi:hypothetical protein